MRKQAQFQEKSTALFRAADILGMFILSMAFTQVIPAAVSASCNVDVAFSSILSSVLSVMFCLAAYRRLLNVWDEEPPMRKVRPLMWCILAAAVLSYLLVDQTIFLWMAQHIPDTGMAVREDAAGQMDIGFLLFYSLVAAPISEECMFRIFFYHQLQKDFSWEMSMVITSVMFGFVHLTIPHLVAGTLFGVILCLIMEYTQNIWITIVCHIFYNFATLAATGNEMSTVADSTASSVSLVLAVLLLIGILTAKRDSYLEKTRGKT